MTLKINPIVAILVIAGALILIFALFRGCKQAKIELAARQKAEELADSTLNVLKTFKATTDSTTVDFQIKNELLIGQIELAKSQKEKAESDLEDQIIVNNALIDKHKLVKYADTNTTVVPAEYIADCEGCFTNLEKTNKEANKYKSDVDALQDKLKNQDGIYQNRFKQLEEEKLGFYNRINSLTQQQKEVADKLKPHGRLYLSWGILFAPWPTAAGGGLLYQNKRNFIIGAHWYYGDHGHMVETTINFPLSIKL